MLKKYIAYLRVSTKKQERSGLGLEAQLAIVEHYAKVDGAEIVQTHIEAESGKTTQRPKLQLAISQCVNSDCTLIVAKLDRLSRDIQDTFGILKQLNNKLISCDIPTSNGVLDTFTLAVFAGLAQRERELISIRTKQALQAKKARGYQLGTPENLTDEARRKGANINRKSALEATNNKVAYSIISARRREGATFQMIADELNQTGLKTSRGKQYERATVKMILDNFTKKRIENSKS